MIKKLMQKLIEKTGGAATSLLLWLPAAAPIPVCPSQLIPVA
jgi:hypothetical protein